MPTRTIALVAASLFLVAQCFIPGTTAQAAARTGVSKPRVQHHHWQPKKHTYGTGMRARRGGCQMSGNC
jgi:hypothetical protein